LGSGAVETRLALALVAMANSKTLTITAGQITEQAAVR
jgi:hypothetical protein